MKADSIDCAKCARAFKVIITCCGCRIREFFCWIVRSISDPDNLPHYLVAIFTLGLTIFACYAWLESRKGTAALEGQLRAMQADQRPYIWMTNSAATINLIIPTGAASGQITFNFPYTNYGRGVAYKFRRVLYLKIKSGPYELSYGETEPDVGATGTDVLPPGKIDFVTAASKPGVTQEEFTQMLKTDGAIGLLANIEYFDIYGTMYSDSICTERLASSALTYRDPKTCKQ
jgi:hypothetical protein